MGFCIGFICRFFPPTPQGQHIGARGHASLARPGVHPFGFAGGEVVHFPCGPFPCRKVPTVDFPGDEFPFAVADGAIAFVFPEQGIFAIERPPLDRRQQRNAFHRFDRVPAKFVGYLAPDKSTQVAMMSTKWPGCDSSCPRRRGSNALRPMHDERRADAAYVAQCLYSRKGVLETFASPDISDVGIRRAGHDATARADRRPIAFARQPDAVLACRAAGFQSSAGGSGSGLRPMVSAHAPLSFRYRITVLSNWPMRFNSARTRPMP